MKRFLFFLGTITCAQFAMASYSLNGIEPVDQAFHLQWEKNEKDLILTWDIHPCCLLYKSKISVLGQQGPLIFSQDPDLDLDKPEGFQKTYKQRVSIKLRHDNTMPTVVKYQGCSTRGFCYPPIVRHIPRG